MQFAFMKKLLFLVALLPHLANGQIISTYAGNGVWRCSPDARPAADSCVGQLGGVAVDTAGNVFLSCINCSNVRKINTAGTLHNFAGTGYPFLPSGLAIDKAGDVLVCDNGNSVLLKVAPTGTITTLAGNASVIGGGFSGNGGPATAALLNFPTAVAVDTVGNIFIADAGNNGIRKISPAGIITQFAGNGIFGTSGDGGPATNAAIRNPTGLAADRKGNVFIVDYQCVRKVNSAGIITTVAGNGTAGYLGDNGPGTAAALNSPISVVADKHGNIYIADSKNNAIRMLDTNGIITTIAGNGAGIDAGDGHPATLAGLNDPEYVAIDKNGFLYIAEINGARLRKIDTCQLPEVAPIMGDSLLCAAGATTLSAAPAGGTWSVSDTALATITTAGTVTALGRGTVLVSYTLGNGCGTVSQTKQLLLAPAGQIVRSSGTVGASSSGVDTFCIEGTIALLGGIPGGVWGLTDSAAATFSGGMLTPHLYSVEDTLYYAVSSSCGNDTSFFRFVISWCPDGVHGVVAQPAAASLYPNPATNLLHLDAVGAARAQVWCADGRQVMDIAYAPTINIFHLPKGLYLLVLLDADGLKIVQLKLVKQ